MYISKKLQNYLSIMAILSAAFGLVAVGLFGLSKGSQQGTDFFVFYKAGSLLLEGVSPWIAMMGDEMPFAYPPHATSVFLAYAYLPKSVALFLHNILNIFSMLVILWFSNKHFIHAKFGKPLDLAQGVGLSVILGSTFAFHLVFLGQITIMIYLALLLSWHALKRHYIQVSSILLAFATFKPQVALVYIIWLSLNKEFKVIIYAGVYSIFLMIPSIYIVGLIDSFKDWLLSIENYTTRDANTNNSQNVYGLSSFLRSLGIETGYYLIIIPTLLMGFLYVFRERLPELLIFHTLMFVNVMFVYAHDVDMILLAVLWGFFFVNSIRQNRLFLTLIGFVFLLMLSFPQRIIRPLDIEYLIHYREIVTLAFFMMTYIFWGQILMNKDAHADLSSKN